MEKRDRFKAYKKKVKSKKISFFVIALIVAGIAIAYLLYQNFSMENQILRMKLEQNSSSSIINTSNIDCNGNPLTLGIKTFINEGKYSLFVKFLIFLGAIYLIQIGLSAFVDIIELIAFAFVSIRGMYRLPNRIKLYLKERKENR